MSLGQIFGGAWKDYKLHFRTSSLLLLLWYIIPFCVVGLFFLSSVASSNVLNDMQNLNSLVSENQSEFVNVSNLDPSDKAIFEQASLDVLTKLGYLTIIGLFLLLVLGLFSSIASLSLFILAFKDTKQKVFSTSRATLSYFWRFIGLSCLFIIILIGLYFGSAVFILIGFYVGKILGSSSLGGLLAAACAIFAITFCIFVFLRIIFAPYVLVDKNLGVFNAIRSSWKLVKGQWWYVLGVSLLLILVTSLISLLLFVLRFIFDIFFAPEINIQDLSSLLSSSSITYGIVSLVIFQSILAIITMPYSLFFMKHLYKVLSKRSRT